MYLLKGRVSVGNRQERLRALQGSKALTRQSKVNEKERRIINTEDAVDILRQSQSGQLGAFVRIILICGRIYSPLLRDEETKNRKQPDRRFGERPDKPVVHAS
jgi:hypothetical protein